MRLKAPDNCEACVGSLSLFEVLGVHNPIWPVLVQNDFHPDLVEVARVDGVFVYMNKQALPRARVVGRVDVVSDQARAIDWLRSHDLRTEAVVEGGRAISLTVDSVEAKIVAYAPDRIAVSARGPGLLVLSEVFERDWRASVDGAAVEVYPTDGVLRGVYLEAGDHQIEFAYDPVTLKAAVVASGIGLVAALGCIAGMRIRRRAAT